MAKILFVDDKKCTGCRLCEMYCSLTRSGTCNPEQSRVRVIKVEEKGISVPVLCQQCHDAPCVTACPVNALTQDETNQRVNLDSDVCIRCHTCLAVCPFGALSVRADGGVIKCDQCGGDPACARMCPVKAIEYIEGDRLGLARKRQGIQALMKVRLPDVAGG